MCTFLKYKRNEKNNIIIEAINIFLTYQETNFVQKQDTMKERQ